MNARATGQKEHFVCFCHESQVIFVHRTDGKKQEILDIFFLFLYFLLLFLSLSLPIQCNTNEIQHSIPFRSYVIKQATFLTLILVQYINKEQGMHTPHTHIHTNTLHSLALFRSLVRSFAHSLAPHTSRCARLGVSTSSLLPRHGSQRNLSHSVAYTPGRCICIIHIFVSAMPMPWLGTFYRNVFVYLFVSRFCQATFPSICFHENIRRIFPAHRQRLRENETKRMSHFCSIPRK